MTFPLVIIDSTQLAFYVFIGVLIGLFIWGPLGLVIGQRVKRLPISVRRDLRKIDMLETTLITRDKELADAESRNADLEGGVTQSNIMIDRAILFLEKAKKGKV